NTIPISQNRSNPKVGDKITFRIPPMRTADHKITWNFGDGAGEQTGTKTSVSNRFDKAGTYQLFVRIKGGDGFNFGYGAKVTVGAEKQKPKDNDKGGNNGDQGGGG